MVSGYGAAHNSNLNSCTVVSNWSYGVSWVGPYNQSRLTNCIVYYNAGGNYFGATLSYCCTTPLASGAGNFTNAPQLFVDGHLTSTSPCRGAGTNLVTGTDIFGQPWLNPPSVGCAEWQPAPMVTQPRLQLTSDPVGFTVNVSGLAGQPPFTNFWIKDGVPLQDDGHFSSSQTTNLVATGVSFADAGAYQLVVTNAFGAVTSSVARLVVHCVDAAGVNPVTPYSTWATAATNIQDAISAALARRSRARHERHLRHRRQVHGWRHHQPGFGGQGDPRAKREWAFRNDHSRRMGSNIHERAGSSALRLADEQCNVERVYSFGRGDTQRGIVTQSINGRWRRFWRFYQCNG